MTTKVPYGFYMANTKVGQVFNDFTVVEPIPSKGKANVRCKCGNFRTVQASALHSGRQQSCGCESKHFIGEIVNGRRVVRRGTTNDPCLIVECLKCSFQSKIRAGYNESAACRNCEGFDFKLITNGVVYALVCPFTGDFKYVGGTRDPDLRARMRDHFKCRLHPKKMHKPVYAWIRELEVLKIRAKIIPLEVVTTGNLHERETFWAKKLTAEGYQLFNIDYNLNNNPRNRRVT